MTCGISIGSFFAASLWVAISSSSAQAAETFFVSEAGSDQASGRTAEQAWATLAHALRRAVATPSNQEIIIAVLPGLYLRQRIRLQWPAAAPRIVVRAYDPANRPLFDGSGRGAWLIIEGAGEARHLGLTVGGLHVRSYQTAISLNGDKFAEGAFLWDAAIVNNRFERIGSRRPDLKPSTAAVRLVNARDVRIARNEFVSIINDEQCSLLHAIYLAHHAGSNLIEGNTFRDGCGATVRVRDDSSDNRVVGNRFEQQRGGAFMQDWFCDRSRRAECSKQECPSWGNLFAQNVVDGSALPVRVTGPDIAPTCPEPRDRRRVVH